MAGSVAKRIDFEVELARDIGEMWDEPLDYVMYSFPWAKKGTPLEHAKGPRDWQRGFLIELGQEIKARGFQPHDPVPVAPILASTGSGHGIGKSALTAMLIKFLHDTRPFSRGVVTANTAEQLRTKTWSELAKWHSMSMTAHWSEYHATRGNLSLSNKSHPETWRVDAQTCREENSEAFAGLHAANSTPFYIFDEASAVPDKIWDVAMGGLTDGEPMWFAFGNPTRNSGRFFETHHRLSHRWRTRSIDSRSVEGHNAALFKQWADDWGEDSDFFKVRVKGEFPSAGSLQFIPADVVRDCMAMVSPKVELYEPLIFGVDVARFGDDASVIQVRRGRNARDFGRFTYRGLDTMQLAARVAEKIVELKPDAVFVDGGGVGGGVVDRLLHLGHDVTEVNFGSKPLDNRYANKRCEMWGHLRDALKQGLAIENDRDLENDLVAVEYGFNSANKIQLESKDEMKSRGLSSPDRGDALALTYALPVGPRDPWRDDRSNDQGRPGNFITDHEDA